MKKIILAVVVVLSTAFTTQAQVSSNSEVKQVFDFVFGSGSGNRLRTITSQDKQKANMLVRELVSKSCAMSGAETLFKSTVSPASSVKGILRSFAIRHFKGCATDIKNGKIYESVRVTLKRNWKSAFEIRAQTGEW